MIIFVCLPLQYRGLDQMRQTLHQIMNSQKMPTADLQPRALASSCLLLAGELPVTMSCSERTS